MSDLSDTIARAIADEIERAKLAGEKHISLSRLQSVAANSHDEWRRLNNPLAHAFTSMPPIGIAPGGLPIMPTVYVYSKGASE